jgi:hypothetical protein
MQHSTTVIAAFNDSFMSWFWALRCGCIKCGHCFKFKQRGCSINLHKIEWCNCPEDLD